jgi:hypothetical protein
MALFSFDTPSCKDLDAVVLREADTLARIRVLSGLAPEADTATFALLERSHAARHAAFCNLRDRFCAQKPRRAKPRPYAPEGYRAGLYGAITHGIEDCDLFLAYARATGNHIARDAFTEAYTEELLNLQRLSLLYFCAVTKAVTDGG